MKKISSLLSLFILTCGICTLQTVRAQNESHENPVQNVIEKIGGAISNVTTTTVIAGKFAADPLLNPLQINISTDNDIVTLSGNVNSKTQYERAVQLATATNDVKSVNATGLTVTPSANYTSDAFITFKIKSLLLKNSIFNGQNYDASNIHVETNNGVVYLVGYVKSEDAINQVLDTVRSVKGVENIIADLRVAV